MPRYPTTLAIDQGTSSTRALRLDPDGTARVVVARRHQQHHPRPGWVEHDPEELLANVRACLDHSPQIDAIGIDNQGESCLAWRADTGEPLSPVIVWQDNRTQSVTDQLRADGVEAMVLERAGLPLDPYFSAAKLGWLMRTVPGAAALLRSGHLRLGTTDAFFLSRLSGLCVTDITTASRTSLMNLETGQWDAELCRLFGVPMDALPEIVPTTGDFGQVDLGHGRIPITASVVDQQAALYGHGCRRPGAVKMTFGTGAFALLLTGDQCVRAPEQGLLPTIAWQRAGAAPVYALDGGVYCASSALDWARSLGLFDSFAELEDATGASAIERGLCFVPALAGLACPHWDRKARGVWLGLALEHSRLDLVRAILEGVALRAAEVLAAMNERIPLAGPLSIDGGMTANRYFCQFLADAVNRPVQVPQMAESTALGTALLATGAPEHQTDDRHAITYQPQRDLATARARFACAVALARDW